jgi:hypothetical protein
MIPLTDIIITVLVITIPLTVIDIYLDCKCDKLNYPKVKYDTLCMGFYRRFKYHA